MEKRITLIVMFLANQPIWGVPINNGFKVKFKQDETKPKVLGALFAKIPQELRPEAFQKEILSKAYLTHSSELGSGCTNQIAKILIPSPSLDEIPQQPQENDNNYINIPLIDQPFRDYKIIVATAPSNIRLSGNDSKPLVVFIVFSEDDKSNTVNIPKVFFVQKGDPNEVIRGDKVEPVLLVDNNRTVTGLKSNEVAKYIKFKNRFTNRYNYDVVV